jgi:hypothetical protein
MELISDTIYLAWNEDGYWTNLPRDIIDHTREGYEWGMVSDGAADLALNILHWALEKRGYKDPTWQTVRCIQGEVSTFAYVMHQNYKRQVIAMIPHKGAKITLQEVWEWIDKYPQLPPFRTEENEE